jgi:hypothetical protein
MQMTGLVTCCAGILSAGFVTKAWHLILSLGVAYGLGAAFLYYPGTDRLVQTLWAS